MDACPNSVSLDILLGRSRCFVSKCSNYVVWASLWMQVLLSSIQLGSNRFAKDFPCGCGMGMSAVSANWAALVRSLRQARKRQLVSWSRFPRIAPTGDLDGEVGDEHDSMR